MMEMTLVDIFGLSVVLVMSVAGVGGFASGGPTYTCGNLLPDHGAERGTNPYRIDIVSPSEYTPGQAVTFRISGGSFEGLMLQARRPGSSSPVGKFSDPPANVKTMRCRLSDDTLTNSRSFSKADGTLFKWTPSGDLGDVQFVGTVMKSENVWWRNVKSSVIKKKSNDTPKTTMPPVSDTGNKTVTYPATTLTPSVRIPYDTNDGDDTNSDMRLVAFVIVTYLLALFL